MSLRVAHYSGSFYPSGKFQLNAMIEGLLEKNVPNFKKLKIDPKKIRAAITPHAGYVYSGATAAFTFNSIKKTKPKSICLFGPSHHELISGAFTFQGFWETPIGKTEVVSFPKMPVLSLDNEHCLEVELPFLQKVFHDHFEFLPVIYGDVNSEDFSRQLEIIADHSFLLASSDLSHFMPYEQAKVVDAITIQAILELDIEKLQQKGDACGLIGIIALCLVAKRKNWKPIILDYRNSGDSSGNKKGVVGYASIIFVEQ